ncbi:zinc finger protein 724-like isoform X2 [Acipenser ruthenus]|uniref:zinc finger protein 724-like isoform X2 n=1 Tax=Acipenser ruthenus TaxID=7906 RepID=UPI002740F6F0|nr:zinc finger protein 724-like isoform X2 [Acipenser ruthenus]
MVLLDSKERTMEPVHVTEEGVEWKHSAKPKQFKQQTHDVQNHKETPALQSDSTAEDISDLGSLHSKEEVIDPELEAACITDETTEPVLESDPFAADVNELGSGYNLREVPEHKITLDMDQEPQSNPCPHCQFSFYEEHLEKHIKDTHPEQIPAADSPCSCSVCGRSFSRPYSLKEHQRIHTRETPYHCSECDQSFGRLFSFKRHQQLHRDEAPFHCSDCGKSFRESENTGKFTLERHLITVLSAGAVFARLDLLQLTSAFTQERGPITVLNAGKDFEWHGPFKPTCEFTKERLPFFVASVEKVLGCRDTLKSTSEFTPEKHHIAVPNVERALEN